MKTSARRRLAGAGLLAIAIAGMAACSSASSTKSAPGTAGAAAAGGGTFTVWDPYPQFDASSAWSKLLTSCGSSAGVTVKRTGYDTTDLTNKTLLAAQQGNAPDVLIVDNPVVSTLAEAGVLATTADAKIETSAFLPNLIAAASPGTRRTACRSARTPWRCTTTRRSSTPPASTPRPSRRGTR